eukprot:10021228-Ditylum_brightwellii.AAC.1
MAINVLADSQASPPEKTAKSGTKQVEWYSISIAMLHIYLHHKLEAEQVATFISVLPPLIPVKS